MGCGLSNELDNNTVIAPKNYYHQQVEKKLLPLLSVNHAGNVNKKYLHISKVVENKFSGKDIFKTNSYISLVSKKELMLKREEFWGKFKRNEIGRYSTCMGGIKVLYRLKSLSWQDKTVERGRD